MTGNAREGEGQVKVTFVFEKKTKNYLVYSSQDETKVLGKLYIPPAELPDEPRTLDVEISAA